MLLLSKDLCKISNVKSSIKSSYFVKYSSYLALSICLAELVSPSYAMEYDQQLTSTTSTQKTSKIKNKGFKPPVKAEPSLSYDKTRDMYYYGNILTDNQIAEKERNPVFTDETALVFELSQDPMVLSSPSAPPILTTSSLSSNVVEETSTMKLIEIKKSRTINPHKREREAKEEETQSFKTLEETKSIGDSNNELLSEQTQVSSDQKKGKVGSFESFQKVEEEEEKQEKVLGSIDRRIKVLTPGIYPWSVHGQLKMEFLPTSHYIGSGTLIGEKYLVTAAHNLYDRKTGITVGKVQFLPGKEGTTIPYKSKATHFIVHPQWYNTSLSKEDVKKFDIAVIRLKKPLGKSAGYYGYREFDEAELTDTKLNVTGYPGGMNAGKYMYTMEGNLTKTDNDRLYYDIDTSGGQSGSAIWANIQDADDREAVPYVVGVHAYGSFTTNSGTRLNSEKATLLQEWLKKLENI